MPHALIVEDDLNTREALVELIAIEGFEVSSAGSVQEAQAQFADRRPDIILVDLQLPDGNGIDLVTSIGHGSGTQVVLITGHASIESAIEALRLGAADYLTKPVNIRRLKALLSRVPRNSQAHSEIDVFRTELTRLGRFGNMLGVSPAMQTLYDHVTRVAPTEASVLLLGESGTGKELAAQTIHELSLRQKQPFLPVNCGAISPHLIESEIFGHERGSFTGADRQHKGYFERANAGTLFLDEITEMPVELQVKLLRVLESGTFMRIGGHQELDTDVRIVAATNRNPEEAVREGKLRLDLYHRLNVFPLKIPALRERGSDVELLAQHFLSELNAANRSAKVLAPEALKNLNAYHWPGNVRELKNYMQRAFILSDEVIDACSLTPVFSSQDSAKTTLSVSVGTSLADVDRQLIFATLESCGGVKKRAADILGISLKTLYNRLEEYGENAGDEEEETHFPPEVDNDASAGNRNMYG
ncbi:sigma-54 dependent transcriptional regulator [Oxalobacteraceae bacterium R-40]|uniref:Sigma-54 dependent transcriptional regulator n=1 Tax=Keguizhuia sedimenti TaxID=3064264 RepID=A0ABU1BN94_9BURK|nr:sigma-54 dependent transcriptional regulator [Oxalobacteraceae bacterium R-40]